jgi:hypothetical protein
MTTEEELAADVIDLDGELAQWLDREMQIYGAHAGRDVTAVGFREHLRKMVAANPKLLEMVLADFVTAFIEREGCSPTWLDDVSDLFKTEDE